MGRFRIEPGPLDITRPLKMISNTGASLAEQGKSQLKIITKVGASAIKSRIKNVLIGGEFDPKELMDPAKYFTEGQLGSIDNLLGKGDGKKKFLTPYGATATDYLVLMKNITQSTEASNAIKNSSEDVAESNSTTQINADLQFVDLSALVTITQKKNIILTTVEGRDRSRKEYISGGDYMVTISGNICDKKPDRYPEEQVRLLKRMMAVENTDDPVISVNNPLLNMFDITGLIILDFKLSQRQASRNSQAYEISAVFEEPAQVLSVKYEDELKGIKKALKNINEWVALDTFAIKSLDTIKTSW